MSIDHEKLKDRYPSRELTPCTTKPETKPETPSPKTKSTSTSADVSILLKRPGISVDAILALQAICDKHDLVMEVVLPSDEEDVICRIDILKTQDDHVICAPRL